MMRRRDLLAGLAAAMLPLPVGAAEPDGYVLDWQGAPVDPAVAARYARQVAAVRALPIDADILAFFARQPLFVQPARGMPSLTGARGVFLTRDGFPDENPVLLHELCHRYQGQRINPVAAKRQALDGFFSAELAAPHWPRGSYLYENLNEFFAMIASCTLAGRTARPPYTRAAFRKAMPALHDWIVAEFAFRG
jgi:hypothetical protein